MAVSVDSVVLDGRFKVLRPLGSGGMGEVFLAEQLSLGRQVALKVLRPELSSQQGMTERFRREAKLLSAVDHPSVVKIIDFGESEGSICLVMELVEGQSLRAMLAGGPLVPDRAIALLTQLAEGLAAIHQKQIVHRDLNPHNVMVTQTPVGEKARLLDFGIARLIEPDAPGSGVSQIGMVIGTAEYLSPEQVAGAPATAQSDLYAFGVMAFEVLSGELPFPGPTPKDYLLQHRSNPPKPLAEAAPHLAEQHRLLELVMRCLSKEPLERPLSAADLATRLAQLPQVGEPTLFSDSMQLPVVPAPPRAAPVADPFKGFPLGGPLSRDLAATIQVQVEKPGVSVHTFAEAQRPLPAGPARAGALRGLDRRVLAGGALAAMVALALISLWLSADSQALVEARRLYDDNQPKLAISSIDAALPKASVADSRALIALKAASMHRLGNHREELPLLDKLDAKSSEWKDPRVLTGLVEDFARREEASYRKILDALPRASLRTQLEGFLEVPPALRQWGALRYLDLAEGLELPRKVLLYSAALERPECGIRGRAAGRLGELHEPSSKPALVKLRDTPKGSGLTDTGCGQEEAAAALRKLERPLSAK